MKKITVLLTALLFTLSISIRADEGMWILSILDRMNMERMHEMGLELSKEDLYSINQSSIKDAVVNFGGFCTGEIVSDKGLIFTNHHCGESAIHEVSTREHNYLKNGFWAGSMEEEIPIKDLYVSFLVRIEEVTDRINSKLSDDMTEDERQLKIQEITNQIEQEATGDNHYNARIKSFFEGNAFYLLVYETYNDIRLVGAPPKSIGNFGGDTDNWMWPRHTGDFSVFRVYAGPDGKPAAYAEDNEPLKPDHHLPISLKGLKDGDFSMIMGYPGGTDRYTTSYGVKEAKNLVNPTRIKVREKILEIMENAMNSSEDLDLKYSSKHSRISNYYKYSIGQNEGLQRLDVIEERQKLEDEFRKWVSADEAREEKYGNTLEIIKEAYDQRGRYYKTALYLNEALYGGFEISRYAGSLQGLYQVLKNHPDSTKAIQAEVKGIRNRMKDFYKDYHAPTDRKLMTAMLEVFDENVPEKLKPTIFERIDQLYDGDYENYTDMLFDHSMFVSMDRLKDYLEEPSLEGLENDPAFVFTRSVEEKVRKMSSKYRSYAHKLNKGQRLFMQGLRKMQPNKNFYPDANFTMRLTYGDVNDYYPRDAVHYDYFTTLKGIMEKEDPTDDEFIVPQKLSQLYQEKDYGAYGENGTLHVCFISDNDITGGNSGSPVMNGEGELVGIAFDGNWEAMTGDFQFEPELQRTISVDIRYVLFVIDKFAGADRLIDELTIVND